MGRPGKPTGRVAATQAIRRGNKAMRLLSYGVPPTAAAREAGISRQRLHFLLAQKLREHRERQMIGRLREGA